MSALVPQKQWWTAAELERAALPDLPMSKRRINGLATREGWNTSKEHARKRAGRGGGWEYHWSLLPARAQQSLLAHVQSGVSTPPMSDKPTRDDAWATFESLPRSVKREAQRRLTIIQKVEALQANGAAKFAAVDDVAMLDGMSARTIFNWFSMIDGVRADDRLAYLAPRHRISKRSSRATVLDPEFKRLFLADYLRPEAPSMRSVYDRMLRIGKKQGWDIAPLHTVNRWVKRTVSPTTMVLARRGYDALMRTMASQIRDKTALHALEGVNGDFHRFDVFVRFPAGINGEREEISRPQMCAFQDIYSGKMLAYRLDRTPNSHCVQLTLGDMIERWGIPQHVLLDNGREFAAKLITGGVKNRYRFKVKDDDPSGLLTSLGCEIHWARPYSGQSKPIERAFRDLCDRVAKHPAFMGAYTGNRPDAQPENYGSAAVPLDVFQAILDEEMAAHNARDDRRSEVAYGRSFDAVFEESYATAPIQKATEAQRRLWLMGAEGIKTNARTGQINFGRNRYYDHWMSDIAGQKVVIRFDRAALWDGLHVYSADDEYLGFAPCSVKGGFFDIDDARATAKAKKSFTAARRLELDAYRKLAKIGDVAKALEGTAPEQIDRPVATVVRPMFEARRAPEATPIDAETKAQHAAVLRRVAKLDDHRKPPPDVAKERYLRAVALEEIQAQGEPLTKDQARWLGGYQTTPDYRSFKRMAADFGSDFLAKK